MHSLPVSWDLSTAYWTLSTQSINKTIMTFLLLADASNICPLKLNAQPFSSVRILQTIGQFAFPLNHHHNFLILCVWTASWDIMMYGDMQWSLPLMITPSCFPFPVLWAMAHMASCPGSWTRVEAAMPAKPQNTFERRAGKPASTLGSVGRGGHSQRGNNHQCETGLRSWEGARDSAGAVL